MKIKIPNFKEIEIRDYNYFVVGDKVLICNPINNKFEISKKGDKLYLPTKHHICLLKVKIEQSKTKEMTGVWIIPKR